MKVETQLGTARAVQTDLTALLDTATEVGLSQKVSMSLYWESRTSENQVCSMPSLEQHAQSLQKYPGTTRDTIEETINVNGIR